MKLLVKTWAYYLVAGITFGLTGFVFHKLGIEIDTHASAPEWFIIYMLISLWVRKEEEEKQYVRTFWYRLNRVSQWYHFLWTGYIVWLLVGKVPSWLDD